MTVLYATNYFTSVTFRGLEDVELPFATYLFDGVNTPTDNQLLNLGLHEDDKYYVKSVTGLEPPDRNVAIARTAAGGKFQGVTMTDREIVVLIGLNPDWDAGETPKILRHNLYTLLNTGYDPKIDVILNQGSIPVCHEYAYITKFEASIWDSNPAVQLTLTTLNPTFRALAPFSYIPENLSETLPDIYNYGTAETGFMFAVKFTANRNGWFIRTAEDQNVGMTFDMAFQTNDVLSVSTIPGQKYVHWKKYRGKVQNKLGILRSGSAWLQLHPGHNHFVVPAQTGAWAWEGNLSFTAHFWGV